VLDNCINVQYFGGMKLPPKYPRDLHPLSSAELRELWEHNKSPQMRIALWEIRRLKFFITQRYWDVKHAEYLYFPNSPGTLAWIKSELKEEVKEAWPRAGKPGKDGS
jgi:hypothetical protein